MGKQVIRYRTCDKCPGDNAAAVTDKVTFNGSKYDLDLCEKHSLELFSAMMKWLDLGTKTGESSIFDQQKQARAVTVAVDTPKAKPVFEEPEAALSAPVVPIRKVLAGDPELPLTASRWTLTRQAQQPAYQSADMLRVEARPRSCAQNGRHSRTSRPQVSVRSGRPPADTYCMTTEAGDTDGTVSRGSATARRPKDADFDCPDKPPFTGVSALAPPSPDAAVTLQLLLAGVPDSTRRAYASDRSCWTSWTQARQLPVLPMHPDHLAHYAADLLTVGSTRAAHPQPLKPVTVERRLAALTVWSIEQGLPRPDLRPARLVLRGYRRVVKADSPAQAAPLTVPVLKLLVQQAGQRRDAQDKLTLRARRDQALILLGFALGARRSELVAINIEDCTVTDRGLVVTILRAKTRSRRDEVVVPFAADQHLCPVRTFTHYRDALAERDVRSGPLFRPISRTQTPLPRRLSAESVADVVQALTEQAGVRVPSGFSGWSGHSLRRGMATEARRAGADSLRIARLGGWADNSAALARYLTDEDRWEGHPLAGVL